MLIFDTVVLWSLTLAALATALMVFLQWPGSLWRWLTARETDVPLWVLAVMSIILGVATSICSWMLKSLVENSPKTVGQGPAAIIELIIGPFRNAIAVPGPQQTYLQAAIVTGSVAIVLAYLLARMRYSLFDMDIRQTYNSAPRRVVVVGLSELRGDVSETIAKAAALSLDKAAAADLGAFPWQQNLRVLAHHLRYEVPERRRWALWAKKTVPKQALLVVLPSVESSKSAMAFKNMAEACITKSGGRSVRIEIWPRSADYNNLRSLREALRSIIRDVRQRRDVDAHLDEISIDTTAGMKVFSIAGASVTFASQLEFTYVEPASPNRVVAFDVRAEFKRLPKM